MISLINISILHDEKQLAEFRGAKQSISILLRSKPNVMGIGIGLRTRGGIVQDELVIKVYVFRKAPTRSGGQRQFSSS